MRPTFSEQRYGFILLTLAALLMSTAAFGQAQSLGDLQSLTSRRLPVLRVTLGKDPAAGWRALAAAVKSASGSTGRRQ